MTASPTALLLTDLDGTLLNLERKIGERDQRTLRDLAQAGTVRAAATGRTLDSADRVLDDTSPFDYLLFSSGAGVMHWPSRAIVHTNEIPADDVARAADVFTRNQVNFEIHHCIPGNHHFVYRRLVQDDTDFDRRLASAGTTATPFVGNTKDFGTACQLMAIIPPDLALFDRLAREIRPFLNVVRATSPVDHRSIWFEVFPNGVSKAGGAEWLRNHLDIPHAQTYALGNDYNDQDMLEWAAHAAVVENAPDDLRERFDVVEPHTRNPLTTAVDRWHLRS